MAPAHKDVPAPEPCRAVDDILSRLGDERSALSVTSLGDGTSRFDGLKRRPDGIPQRMSTPTLRGLDCDRPIERDLEPTIPPPVSCRWTDLGRSLRGPVSALGRWAIEHRGAVERAL